MGVGGELHGPAVLSRERDLVPIVYETGWASEPAWTDAEISPENWIRSPHRPAHSESHFIYEGNLESKERFAIKKYLLIIGKKKNMQVLSRTFTYFST